MNDDVIFFAKDTNLPWAPFHIYCGGCRFYGRIDHYLAADELAIAEHLTEHRDRGDEIQVALNVLAEHNINLEMPDE